MSEVWLKVRHQDRDKPLSYKRQFSGLPSKGDTIYLRLDLTSPILPYTVQRLDWKSNNSNDDFGPYHATVVIG
jgi:hypothetical protein